MKDSEQFKVGRKIEGAKRAEVRVCTYEDEREVFLTVWEEIHKEDPHQAQVAVLELTNIDALRLANALESAALRVNGG